MTNGWICSTQKNISPANPGTALGVASTVLDFHNNTAHHPCDIISVFFPYRRYERPKNIQRICICRFQKLTFDFTKSHWAMRLPHLHLTHCNAPRDKAVTQLKAQQHHNPGSFPRHRSQPKGFCTELNIFVSLIYYSLGRTVYSEGDKLRQRFIIRLKHGHLSAKNKGRYFILMICQGRHGKRNYSR